MSERRSTHYKGWMPCDCGLVHRHDLKEEQQHNCFQGPLRGPFDFLCLQGDMEGGVHDKQGLVLLGIHLRFQAVHVVLDVVDVADFVLRVHDAQDAVPRYLKSFSGSAVTPPLAKRSNTSPLVITSVVPTREYNAVSVTPDTSRISYPKSFRMA